MRPLVPYEPNPALGWLYRRFFDRIEVDEAWISAVRDAESRGTVVYALRNLSFVDFLALDHLTKRFRLPEIHFANDTGLWILEPMGRGWLQALGPRKPDDAQDLRRTLERGCSAALFLKRPPTLLDGSVRGQIEGDVFLRTILDMQKTSTRPILLVPQVFVWSKRPDEARYGVMDAVFGPREWPGKLRTVSQFLLNYQHPTLRAGEPLDVRAFLDHDGPRKETDDAVVRRLTYALLRRLERERRVVVGPTKKPADRLREEVIRSPKLQKIISDMAGNGAAERRALTAKALEMVREMETAPDYNAIAAMDAAFKQAFARMYTALEIDHEGIERIRAASKDGTLILLPSHKSHVDYMILSYVFYQQHLQLPIVAAGDNLNFFPLGNVFRKAGAFYIRRSFAGDRLYSAVVDAYMRRLMKDGFSLEFFVEGARSRTGKLLPPKLGLLSIVVDAALGVGSRKVYFCPISIGYERMVEEKAYVREVTGGEKKKENVRGLLSTVDVLLSRYGRLNIQFGDILTLESVFAESGGDPASLSGKLTPPRRRGLVTRMGYRVAHEINRVTAVTPGSLVATALLVHGRRGLAHADLVQLCNRLAAALAALGARFSPSALAADGKTLRTEAVREACDLFLRAGHVEARLPGAPAGSKDRLRAGGEAVYVVPEEGRLSLDLAKNVIVHFFVDRALVATALLASDDLRLTVDALRERVQSLSRLFKYEFLFRADAAFDTIFDETLAAMERAGEIARHGDTLQPAGEAGRAQVVLYAQLVRNFVEAYRIAARGLAALLKGPMTPKDLTKRAITTGDRMFLAGEVERREAICRPVLENACLSFVDQGYLTREDGKLTLPESYASAATVRTIEAKIAGFLPKKGVEES